jgi:hypothetical protein
MAGGTNIEEMDDTTALRYLCSWRVLKNVTVALATFR